MDIFICTRSRGRRRKIDPTIESDDRKCGAFQRKAFHKINDSFLAARTLCELRTQLVCAPLKRLHEEEGEGWGRDRREKLCVNARDEGSGAASWKLEEAFTFRLRKKK